MRWLSIPLVLGLALAAAMGCVPKTRFRNSAVVPAVTPPMRSGRALDHGFRVDGWGGHTGVDTDIITLPEDPALLVAKSTGGMGGRMRYGDMFDFGLRLESALFDSVEPSTLGTAPVPSHKNAYGLGISVQGHWEHKSGFGIAGLYEGTSWTVPYAKWECEQQTSPCPSGVTTPDGDRVPGYMLDEEGTTDQIVHSLSLMPSYRTGLATIFLSMSAKGTITNTGFTNANTDGSTVEAGTPTGIGALGVELALDRFRVLMELHQVGSNPGNNTVGFGISLGFELGPRVKVRPPVEQPQPQPYGPPGAPYPQPYPQPYPPGPMPGPAPGPSPAPLGPPTTPAPPTDPYGGPG